MSSTKHLFQIHYANSDWFTHTEQRHSKLKSSYCCSSRTHVGTYILCHKMCFQRICTTHTLHHYLADCPPRIWRSCDSGPTTSRHLWTDPSTPSMSQILELFAVMPGFHSGSSLRLSPQSSADSTPGLPSKTFFQEKQKCLLNSCLCWYIYSEKQNRGGKKRVLQSGKIKFPIFNY